MSIIISIFGDIIQMLKLILMCELYFLFHKRKKSIVQLLFLFILTVVSSIIIYFKDNSTEELLVYLLYTSLVVIILYKEKVVELLTTALWIVIIVSFIDKISFTIADIIFSIHLNVHIHLEIFLMHIITLLFILLTGILLRKKNPLGLKKVTIIYKIFFLFLTLIDTIVFVCLSDLLIDELQVKLSLGIVFILLGSGLFIQMALCLLLIVSRDLHKENEEITKKYLNIQVEHYKYLEQREKETRKFRHDLKNHIYILGTLYKEEKYKEFKDYLEKIYGKIDSFGGSISVNNGIVDAILNKCAAMAEQHNISINVTGHFPTECYVDSFDLCTIISNLLSNAVGAEYEYGGNVIDVICRYNETEIIICVENDYTGKLIYENGKILSNREDKNFHGYGLQNVRESVEKYDGCVDIETRNNRFIIWVLLKNMKRGEGK